MDYNFIAPVIFVPPKTISYVSGTLIIEIDDGTDGNYTHWLPFTLRLADKYNQWQNSKPVVCCPNVNTAKIGTTGYMTVAQLQELQNIYNWEIMSHGRYHTGLATHTVIVQANAGQKRIDINTAGMIHPEANYVYEIKYGEISETIIVAERHGEPYQNGYILSTENLVNTYPVGSTLKLTEASLLAELQGCQDDLKAWGLTGNSHVYTYHAGSQWYYNQQAVDVVDGIFDSARGVDGDHNSLGANLGLLKSRLLTSSLTDVEIDGILDDTLANDYVTIVYGHGETSDAHLGRLQYFIEGAINRGIQIMTRAEAIMLLR